MVKSHSVVIVHLSYLLDLFLLLRVFMIGLDLCFALYCLVYSSVERKVAVSVYGGIRFRLSTATSGDLTVFCWLSAHNLQAWPNEILTFIAQLN